MTGPTRARLDMEWIALGLQAQVKTLSGQVALLDAHIELLLDRLAEDQPAIPAAQPACEHPEDYRLDAGSMRAPLRFFCKACRRFIDPQAETAVDPAPVSLS